MSPRFAKVFCSQCGGEFGPRDSGYSHCGDHILDSEDATTRSLFVAWCAGFRSEAAKRVLDRAGLINGDGSLSYRGEHAASAVERQVVWAMGTAQAAE